MQRQFPRIHDAAEVVYHRDAFKWGERGSCRIHRREARGQLIETFPLLYRSRLNEEA